MKARGIAIQDYFDAKKPAVLEADHRSFVNYEVYFFADLAEKARFDADPLPYCRLVTDPIIRTRFQPIGLSPKTTHNGRTYYFLTAGNLAAFAADPDSFAVRRGM